jgi:hydrogenase nickel insertion protein HypA
MHEMSIVEGIWSTVEAALDSGGYKKLINVDVVIGEYLEVVKESLDLSWEAVTMEDARSNGALLTITTEPSRVRCRQCNGTWLFKEHWYICPKCGVSDSVVETGKSLYVERIEVE